MPADRTADPVPDGARGLRLEKEPDTHHLKIQENDVGADTSCRYNLPARG